MKIRRSVNVGWVKKEGYEYSKRDSTEENTKILFPINISFPNFNSPYNVI